MQEVSSKLALSLHSPKAAVQVAAASALANFALAIHQMDVRDSWL